MAFNFAMGILNNEKTSYTEKKAVLLENGEIIEGNVTYKKYIAPSKKWTEKVLKLSETQFQKLMEKEKKPAGKKPVLKKRVTKKTAILKVKPEVKPEKPVLKKRVTKKNTGPKKIISRLESTLKKGQATFEKFFKVFFDGETIRSIGFSFAIEYYRGYLRSGLTLKQYDREMAV